MQCATQEFLASQTPGTFLYNIATVTYNNIRDNFYNPFQMPIGGRRLLSKKGDSRSENLHGE